MYLLRCNLLIEIDDFFRHLLHRHAGHDIVLRVRDEDVERILERAIRLLLEEFGGLQLMCHEFVLHISIIVCKYRLLCAEQFALDALKRLGCLHIHLLGEERVLVERVDAGCGD